MTVDLAAHPTHPKPSTVDHPGPPTDPLDEVEYLRAAFEFHNGMLELARAELIELRAKVAQLTGRLVIR